MIDSPVQAWKRSVNDYARLASFTFEDRGDFSRALTAFNEEGGPLNDAPFDIAPPKTIMVPKEAAELWSDWLTERDITFKSGRVWESRELPADIVARGRARNHGPGPR